MGVLVALSVVMVCADMNLEEQAGACLPRVLTSGKGQGAAKAFKNEISHTIC